MNYKILAIVAALLVASFSIGRFSAPKSESSKESEHTESNQNENSNRNQNTVETTKETKLPDGTVIIEKRKEKETSVQTQRETNTETQKDISKTIEIRPSWRVAVGYEPAVKGFQETSYSVTLEKRLFSELYVGVSGSSRKTVGITLSLGF